MTDKRQGPGRRPGSPMAMLGLGFELAVPVLLFLFAGYQLDGWLETRPWMMLAGMALGMVVGFYSLVKRVLPGARGDGSGEGGS